MGPTLGPVLDAGQGCARARQGLSKPFRVRRFNPKRNGGTMSNLFKSVAGAGLAAAIAAAVSVMGSTGGTSKAVAPEQAAPDSPLIGFWYHDLYSSGMNGPQIHMSGTIEYAASGESSVHGRMLVTSNGNEIEYHYTTKGTWRLEDNQLTETTDEMHSEVVAINGEPTEGNDRGLPKLERLFPLGRDQHSEILDRSENKIRLRLAATGEVINFKRTRKHMDF
jgi:hypothetical protein